MIAVPYVVLELQFSQGRSSLKILPHTLQPLLLDPLLEWNQQALLNTCVAVLRTSTKKLLLPELLPELLSSGSNPVAIW